MGRVSDKRKIKGQSPLRSSSSNSDVIIRPSTLQYESGRIKKMKIDHEAEPRNETVDEPAASKSWSKTGRGDTNVVEESVSGSTRSRTSSRASISSEGTISDISSATRSPRTPHELETDPAVLARRVKQIEYGKNTIEYHNYTQAIPKEDRRPIHPKTPPLRRKYSRRAWDGLIKQWRLNLHIWTDPANAKASSNEDTQNNTTKEEKEDSEESDSTSKDEVKYLSWSEEVEEYEDEEKSFKM